MNLNARKQGRFQPALPARESLRLALDRFAATLQASAKLAAEIADLAAVAAPHLVAREPVRAGRVPRADQALVGSGESNQVFVRHFLNGEVREGDADTARAQAVLADDDFDLVVNELDETIRARATKVITRTSLWDLQPEPSGLLWLILSRPGEGIIFDEIERLLGLETGRNQKDRGKRIHQCRFRLIRVLSEELGAKIFMEGKRKWVYRTNDHGWSFCWVRSARRLGGSKLISRCGGRQLADGIG